MKRKLTALLAAALCPLLVACANPKEFSDGETLTKKYTRSSDITQTYNYADGAQDAPTAYNSYTAAVTGFSFKMLGALAETEQSSFVCSPAVCALELGMLANAASGDLRQDILLALGANFSLSDLNACSSYFKSRMETVSKAKLKKDEKTEDFVRLQGAMLLEDGTDVKSAFLQNVADFYGFDVFRYAYGGENADAKLKSYLKNSYPADGLPLDGDMNLVGATHISDTWLSGSERKIQSEKAVGVVKYTAANPLKLVLLMPNEGTTPADYLKRLDTAEYAALLNSADVTKPCTAEVPSFTVKGASTARKLSPALSACGLSALFDGNAGFTAMSYHSGSAVSEMYEAAADFTLDENGVNTEKTPEPAAASNGETIRFNRPFIFMLVDNETDIPVQMGIYQPT